MIDFSGVAFVVGFLLIVAIGALVSVLVGGIVALFHGPVYPIIGVIFLLSVVIGLFVGAAWER